MSYTPIFQSVISECRHHISVKSRPLFIGLGAFLIVLGCRLYFIGEFGVDVPYWDQWNDEVEIYRAFLNGSLTIERLFAPHNEHRILITRLFSIFLFWINAGWSPIFSMAAQAFIPSALTGLFVKWYCEFYADNISILSIISIVVAFASPFNWENLLWGFQSHLYFMVFWGVIAIKAAIRQEIHLQATVWVVVSCLLAALSQGGGFTVPFVIGLVWVYYAITSSSNRRFWITAASIAFILSYLLSLLLMEVPGHASYHAKDIEHFFISLIVILGWPDSINHSAILIFWLPGIIILLRHIIRRTVFKPHQLFSLSILAWVGVMACGTAYTRSQFFENRYGDYLVLIVPATVLLFDSLRWGRHFQGISVTITLIKIVIILGFLHLSFHAGKDLTKHQRQRSIYVKTLETALKEQDLRPGKGYESLRSEKPISTLPHPSFRTIGNVIFDPEFSPYLPDGIKIPTVMSIAEKSSSGIVFESINNPKKTLLLYWAGRLNPGTLEILFEFSPSGSTYTVNDMRQSNGMVKGKWHVIRVNLPYGTKETTVRIIDRDTSDDGWISVAGFLHPNRFGFLDTYYSMLGIFLIGFGSAVYLFYGLRYLKLKYSVQVSISGAGK